MGKEIDLSIFLKPNVFLNCFRQESARSLGVTIDKVSLLTSVESSSESTSFFASNISIFGAKMLGGVLQPCTNSDSEFSPLPNICFCFVEKTPVDSPKLATIPLFKNSTKEEFLCYLQLPSDKAQRVDLILKNVTAFLEII
ncbi:hypothetical protein GEMRC1_010949 [Eukaryota sp. GEM-RC1]